jgi:hypothetical protein
MRYDTYGRANLGMPVEDRRTTGRAGRPSARSGASGESGGKWPTSEAGQVARARLSALGWQRGISQEAAATGVR